MPSICQKADAEASAFWFAGRLAAAIAAAAVVVVAAAQAAVTAAAQDQEKDQNPGASAKVVVAHIELPPFELHYSVWKRGKSCYSL